MLSEEQQQALIYVETLISRNTKMLEDNEKLLSSKNLTCNPVLVQKKIDDITPVLDNLYFIRSTLLGEKEPLPSETSVSKNEKDSLKQEDPPIISKNKKKKVVEKDGFDNELLKKLYPEFPDNLLTELRFDKHDIIVDRIKHQIDTSKGTEITINDMIIGLYTELNLIVKRDVIYGICSKLHLKKLIQRGGTPGSYKKV